MRKKRSVGSKVKARNILNRAKRFLIDLNLNMNLSK